MITHVVSARRASEWDKFFLLVALVVPGVLTSIVELAMAGALNGATGGRVVLLLRSTASAPQELPAHAATSQTLVCQFNSS